MICLRRPWTWPTDFRSISLFYCCSFFFCYFQLIGTHLSCMCTSFAHTDTHTRTHQVRLQLLVVNFKLPTTSTSSTTVMSAALLTLSRPPHIYALCLCVWVCVCVCFVHGEIVICLKNHLYLLRALFCCFAMPNAYYALCQRLFLCLLLSLFSAFLPLGQSDSH